MSLSRTVSELSGPLLGLIWAVLGRGGRVTTRCSTYASPLTTPLGGLRPTSNSTRSYRALSVTYLARSGKRIYFERAREIAGKVVLKLLGAAWGLFEGLLGAVLERSWAVLRLSEALLERSWALLGRLGALLGRLGALLDRLGALLGRLGGLLELSWAVLGASWAGHHGTGPLLERLGIISGPFGTSWGALGPSWSALGPSWKPLGPLLGRLGCI